MIPFKHIDLNTGKEVDENFVDLIYKSFKLPVRPLFSTGIYFPDDINDLRTNK